MLTTVPQAALAESMEKRVNEAELKIPKLAELKIAKLEAQLEAATARANSEMAAARSQAEIEVAAAEKHADLAEKRASEAEQRCSAFELMHESNAELMQRVEVASLDSLVR